MFRIQKLSMIKTKIITKKKTTHYCAKIAFLWSAQNLKSEGIEPRIKKFII